MTIFASWYCMYHEAVDYFRERKRQRGWETSFETLPLSELDTLCTIDQYPSDSFIFPAYGCELQISDGLVAAAMPAATRRPLRWTACSLKRRFI